MANTDSAKKRARQNEKRRVHNRYYKATARTFVKQARTSVASGDTSAAEEAVLQAIKALDKAAQKGTIHPNNAARRKSRLVQMLNKAKAEA